MVDLAPSRDKIREIVFGLPAVAEKKSISSHLQPSTTLSSPPPAPLTSGKDAETPPDVASGRHRGSLSVCQTAIKQKQKVKANLTSKNKLFTMEKYKFLSRDLFRIFDQFLLIIIPQYLFDFIRHIFFCIYNILFISHNIH